MTVSRRFWTWLAASVVLVIALSWVAIDWWAEVYGVTVENRSAQILTDVEVLIVQGVVPKAAVARTVGTLAPGASRRTFVDPEGDGSLQIRFHAGGRAHVRGIDYVSTSAGTSYHCTVLPSLLLDCKVSSWP